MDGGCTCDPSRWNDHAHHAYYADSRVRGRAHRIEATHDISAAAGDQEGGRRGVRNLRNSGASLRSLSQPRRLPRIVALAWCTCTCWESPTEATRDLVAMRSLTHSLAEPGLDRCPSHTPQHSRRFPSLRAPSKDTVHASPKIGTQRLHPGSNTSSTLPDLNGVRTSDGTAEGKSPWN